MKILYSRTWSIIALLAFAFVLRAAFLFLAGVNAPLTGDEFAYQQIAENLTAGRGFFQTNNPFFPGQVLYAWQAPLYPLLLGALYKFVGSNILVAKLLGIVVSTATVYVVYDLTRRVFRAPLLENVTDETRAHNSAFVAGFLVAIYPGFLTLAHLLLSEGLFIFFVMLAFGFVARALDEGGGRKWLWLAAAGVAWGSATLTRGLTLYFTPLLALWLAWIMWRTRGGSRSNVSCLPVGAMPRACPNGASARVVGAMPRACPNGASARGVGAMPRACPNGATTEGATTRVRPYAQLEPRRCLWWSRSRSLRRGRCAIIFNFVNLFCWKPKAA
ncbi:MAG: glycosyltransferase family 39 protein [Chloroflexi bacterium]|nr:glycosyltransferase family 39 protein [Chloroflexota bacterium]